MKLERYLFDYHTAEQTILILVVLELYSTHILYQEFLLLSDNFEVIAHALI